MDRKDFIKKGIFGTGMFAATAAFGNIMQQDAWFHLGTFDKNNITKYTVKKQTTAFMYSS